MLLYVVPLPSVYPGFKAVGPWQDQGHELLVLLEVAFFRQSGIQNGKGSDIGAESPRTKLCRVTPVPPRALDR